MRRHGDRRVRPERVIRRQRFDAERVERGAGESPRVQRGEQIRVDDRRAAADVDQMRAA
jgi:hypothetical protein